jgi:hypothetical protein
MNDKRSDEFPTERLIESARDYNEPPATPHEDMWEQISVRRAASHTEESVGSRPPFYAEAGNVALPWWRTRKLLWPVAAAAVLVIGIGIGRLSVPVDRKVDPVAGDTVTSRDLSPEAGTVAEAGQNENPRVEIPSPGTADQDGRSRNRQTDGPNPYMYAAAPFLGQAEVLLAQYRTGEIAGSNGDSFTTRATRLLAQTRLLLDSPAAEDAQLEKLLSDLELVLARLVRFADGENEDEKEWIDENLQQRFLLPRLRAQIPVGAALTTL